MAEASTDVRGRYGRDCKTAYSSNHEIVYREVIAVWLGSDTRRLRHRIWRSLLGAALFALTLGAATAADTPPVTVYTSCNGLTAAPVFAEFDVPDGASIFKHFPALGITPEISNPSGPLHDGPLHVVALTGPVCNLPIYGPLLRPGTAASLVFGNIIRVIKLDRDEWDMGYGDYDTFVP